MNTVEASVGHPGCVVWGKVPEKFKSHKDRDEVLNLKSTSLALTPSTAGYLCGAISLVGCLPFPPLDSLQPLKGIYCDLSQI